MFSPDLLAELKEFATTSSASSDVKIIRSLIYVVRADSRRAGDLYLPEPRGQKRPAVILIHSGDRAELVSYLNGKTPKDAPRLYADASPLTYGRTAVPTFFAHGTADHNVPITQSTAMAAVLQRNGIRAEVVAVEGASHWFGPVTRELVLARVVVFLDQVFNTLPVSPSGHTSSLR